MNTNLDFFPKKNLGVHTNFILLKQDNIYFILKALLANISWTAIWVHKIELALESAYQTVYNII